MAEASPVTVSPAGWQRASSPAPTAATTLWTVAEAMHLLRHDGGAADHVASVTALIIGAVDYAEQRTGRSFLEQHWTFRASDLPEQPGHLKLHRPPVQEVTTVEYRDADGDWTDYGVINTGFLEGSVDAQVWRTADAPTLYENEPYPWRVTVRCGYGTTQASVPASIRRAVGLLIRADYGEQDAGALRAAANSYLGGYRVPGYC